MIPGLLITSGGNPQTFSNVVFALSHHLADRYRVEKITVLDEGTAVDGYQDCAERILGHDVELRQRRVTGDPRSAIAKLVVDGAREMGRNSLIVDLTAGSKLISAILYATASFAQLEHLYYVRVDRTDGVFVDLTKELNPYGSFRVEMLAPLREVKDLGSQCYFDLLFYEALLDEVDTRGATSGNSEVASVTVHLRQAICHFFSVPGRYQEAIQAIGVAREVIQGLLGSAVAYIEKKPAPLSPKEIEAWSEAYRRNSVQLSPGTTVPNLLVLDLLLNSLRHWRNSAMHKHGAKFGASDVRVALLLTLQLLDALLLLRSTSP